MPFFVFIIAVLIYALEENEKREELSKRELYHRIKAQFHEVEIDLRGGNDLHGTFFLMIRNGFTGEFFFAHKEDSVDNFGFKA